MTKAKATSNPAPAAIEVTPTQIILNAPVYEVLETAAALTRMGWTINANATPMILGEYLTFAMVKGSPSASAQRKAETAIADAAFLAEMEHRKEIERAAVRLLEDQAKAARQAELAASVAVHEEALTKLKAELAAAEGAKALAVTKLQAAQAVA